METTSKARGLAEGGAVGLREGGGVGQQGGGEDSPGTFSPRGEWYT